MHQRLACDGGAGGVIDVSWSLQKRLEGDQPIAGFHLAPGDYVCLRVSDDGHVVGIPEENIEKIFDPFFTTKSQGEGTGWVRFGCSFWYRTCPQRRSDRVVVESK